MFDLLTMKHFKKDFGKEHTFQTGACRGESVPFCSHLFLLISSSLALCSVVYMTLIQFFREL